MSRKIKPPIEIYSALADASRCRIIEILLAGPLPVHALADAFAISRPAISRHLRVLKSAGLVAEVKKGRENLYALKPRRLGRSTDWIDKVAGSPAPTEQALVEAALSSSALAVESIETTSDDRRVTTAAAIAVDAEKAVPRARKIAPVNQMGFDF
ncbi:MAG: winged helix-turn-helix transcriptional regulator [Devosia sp.]|uniref:ArsR/SmtB family transcription factor n=1 Tax=Devosia sp. TaxID=1871048 RepID=UPI0024C86EA4|nr:metalloregulator ArsR/SmtB family transcription factor [Devosia sp.]UYO00029.1 MAG: winged helix-turn-helix transcriptional regulator [Devosia sp.]